MPEESRRIGLPNTPAVARRAFLSAAGTLLAARLALEHGVACNMAGGSHHAGPEGGAGYCVFNDVAIAAQALLDEGRGARVLDVDCDVHQGDGTARIFAGRDDVLTLSLHAERNYPARKAASDLDYPLPDRLEDRAYLEVLAHALTATEGFAAGLLFYNAGVDPHEGDRLGRLALSDDGLRARDRMVLGWAHGRSLPVAAVLGGGYDNDPYRLAARHAILFEEAARVRESADAQG
jgi:acetoin utilization deacetylase AcuC-like enzyme